MRAASVERERRAPPSVELGLRRAPSASRPSGRRAAVESTRVSRATITRSRSSKRTRSASPSLRGVAISRSACADAEQALEQVAGHPWGPSATRVRPEGTRAPRFCRPSILSLNHAARRARDPAPHESAPGVTATAPAGQAGVDAQGLIALCEVSHAAPSAAVLRVAPERGTPRRRRRGTRQPREAPSRGAGAALVAGGGMGRGTRLRTGGIERRYAKIARRSSSV